MVLPDMLIDDETKEIRKVQRKWKRRFVEEATNWKKGAMERIEELE